MIVPFLSRPAQIDEKVGRDRPATLEDRHQMLYSQAVLYETLRYTSSPIVPHVATEDAVVGGESLLLLSLIILLYCVIL